MGVKPGDACDGNPAGEAEGAAIEGDGKVLAAVSGAAGAAR